MTPALLEVGYIARAHGLQGELGVRSLDPDSDTLLQLKRLWLAFEGGEPREVKVLSARPTPKETLLVLEGIHGRNAAEALRGTTVLAAREDLPSPSEDEYFQGDLVGLRAMDEAGVTLGTVMELWETGPVPNLVIRADGKEDLVIPFADEFVLTVDLEARTVVVRPLEYLE